MEHRLIQGGEQYLPFARSRIKALRATGLKYASQQFEIDGVSIKVRIVGDQEFISLAGVSLPIYSGVIKPGEIVEVAVGEVKTKYLRALKPTQNCWDYTLKKDVTKPVTSFNDLKSGTSIKAETQYREVTPSMFSGTMAKVAAIVLGQLKDLKYRYEWEHTNGVVFDSKGKPWLLEISRTNGVLARRLPMLAGSKTSKVKAESEIVKLLGGVPSGVTFPAPEKLAAAILDKKVIRLATVAQMAPFFDCLPFVDYLGWSFSNAGNEAYNTCYLNEPPDQVLSRLYKLSISIVIDAEGNASGSAILSKEEEGKLFYKSDEQSFVFTSESEILVYLPGGPILSAVPAVAPVLACHINDQLDVVRIHTTTTNWSSTDNPASTLPPYGDYITKQAYGGIYAVGDKAEARPDVHTIITAIVVGRSSVTIDAPFPPPGSVTNEVLFTKWAVDTRHPSPNSRLLHCSGTRDGYAKAQDDDLFQQHTTIGGLWYNDTELAAYLAEGNPLGGYTGIQNYIWQSGQIPGIPAGNAREYIPTTYVDESGYTLLDITSLYVHVPYVDTPVDKTMDFYYPDDTEHNLGTLTGVIWEGMPYLRTRVSMFGPEPHGVHSLDARIGSAPFISTLGDMLVSETTPTTDFYNFIGYIK